MKTQKLIEDSSGPLDRQQLAIELNNKLRFISNQLKKNYHLIARETYCDVDCFRISNASPTRLTIFIPQNKYLIYIRVNYGIRIVNETFYDIINAKSITVKGCLQLINDNYLVYCILRIYEYIYYLVNE